VPREGLPRNRDRAVEDGIKSMNPRYSIKYEINGKVLSDFWNSRWYGRPTPENLAEWVLWKENSYRPGGENAAIAEEYGSQVITAARIELNVRIDQGRRVVAEWQAPTTS
jgi:hypothetical protein